MKPDKLTPQRVSASLRDPNQIAALSGWDLDIQQIESGPMHTDVRVWAGRNVSVLDFSFSRRVHQFGSSPKGQITFGLPTRSRLTNWKGKEIETPPFLSFGSGHEFDCVSDSGFSGTTVTIEAENALRIGERLGLPLPEAGFGAFIAMGLRAPGRAADLVSIVSRLMTHQGAIPTAEEDRLVEALLLIATDATFEPERRQSRRSARGLSKAIEIMKEAEDENLPISAICDAAGVSLRTLERAFNDRFGIGPKTYYTRLRLGRVRSLIVEAGNHLKVADAANRYGFWHIGQFSKDYRQSFGELPSETMTSGPDQT